MQRDHILDTLRQHDKEFDAFHVRSLSLFGSVARNTATEHSDVDVLVEFEGRATFDCYIELNQYLETLLNCHVDLLTKSSLRPEMRDAIQSDIIHVIEPIFVLS